MQRGMVPLSWYIAFHAIEEDDKVCRGGRQASAALSQETMNHHSEIEQKA